MLKRIGLFGGSFDPPHIGHQALVEAALTHFKLDEVWIIPVGVPVHRTLSKQATITKRVSWLHSMFADNPSVRILDWETSQTTATPAIQTLRRFKAENPNNIPLWLMGYDSFLDLPNWVEYPAHKGLCSLGVFQRKGLEKALKTNDWHHTSSDNVCNAAGYVSLAQIDLPDASSTKIRQKPKQHQHQLTQSTCNAILACYASDIIKP